MYEPKTCGHIANAPTGNSPNNQRTLTGINKLNNFNFFLLCEFVMSSNNSKAWRVLARIDVCCVLPNTGRASSGPGKLVELNNMSISDAKVRLDIERHAMNTLNHLIVS